MDRIECANCDTEMNSPEATGYMNQYTDRITYSAKPEKKDALPVHLHTTCKREVSKKPRVIEIANNSVGKGPLGIVK